MSPEEEYSLFLRHLGMAFSAWGNVENSLRNCVIACFREGDRNSLSLGVFAIENFRSKLSFAEYVIMRKLVARRKPDKRQLVLDWAKLVKRARDASALRNALAHRPTHVYEQGNPGRRVVLSPWIYPKPKRRTRRQGPPPGSLGVMDIVRYHLVFYALTASLMNFCHRILVVKEQFPKSDEQSKNPPPVQTLVRLMHEALGHEKKSSRKRRREEEATNAAASLLPPDIQDLKAEGENRAKAPSSTK
jgi:hypothetical protein